MKLGINELTDAHIAVRVLHDQKSDLHVDLSVSHRLTNTQFVCSELGLLNRFGISNKA